MSAIYSRIIGTGSYLPAKVLTNADLAGTVDTSDEWIQQRTGIRQSIAQLHNQPLPRTNLGHTTTCCRNCRQSIQRWPRMLRTAITPPNPRP